MMKRRKKGNANQFNGAKWGICGARFRQRR